MTLYKSLVLSCSLLLASSIHAASVWKVTNGEHTVYVGGTIHILTPQDYPLPKEYEQAYAASQSLVFETDMVAVSKPEFAQKMLRKMTYSDGTTIEQTLKPETYQALAVHLASRQVPLQAFASHKPSLLAISLTFIELNAMGYTSEGVDQFYANKAAKNNKPQSWLETPDEQLAFLAGLEGDDPNAIIEYTLKDIQKMPIMFSELHAAWLAGDLSALTQAGIVNFKNEYPEIYQNLLVKRNNKWLPKIDAMLKDKPIEFILVGALHLAGPDSVLSKLANKGYAIEKL